MIYKVSRDKQELVLLHYLVNDVLYHHLAFPNENGYGSVWLHLYFCFWFSLIQNSNHGAPALPNKCQRKEQSPVLLFAIFLILDSNPRFSNDLRGKRFHGYIDLMPWRIWKSPYFCHTQASTLSFLLFFPL